MITCNTSKPNIQIILNLPAQQGIKERLSNLGIEWINSIDHPFKALGRLPKGWSVAIRPLTAREIRDFYIVDENKNCKAAVWMADSVFDQFARVDLIRKGHYHDDCKIHRLKSDYDTKVHALRKEHYEWNRKNPDKKALIFLDRATEELGG